MFYTYAAEGQLVKASNFDIPVESLNLIQSLPEGENIVEIDAEITYDTDEFREDYVTNGWAYRSVKIEKIVREGEKYLLTCKWEDKETFVVAVTINGRKVIVEDLSSIPLLR